MLEKINREYITKNISKEISSIYNFLTNGNEDLELVFYNMLNKHNLSIVAIVKLQEYIRSHRELNYDDILQACRGKSVLGCKDVLEEIFLEPLNIELVNHMVNKQGWSLENLILEHKNNPSKRIYAILSIPYAAYKIRY